MNKPRAILDKGPWHPWALQRLGLENKHQSFRERSRVERFFRHLKERTAVFHNKLSARDHREGMENLSPFTTCYQTMRPVGG